MQHLLTAMMLWISANAGMPLPAEQPLVARASPQAITSMRHLDLAGWHAPEAARSQGDGREVVSVYSNATHTIYLRDDWKGDTPAELSVLLHELVHHMQNEAGTRFACPAEREKAAYETQDKWLRMFGQSLEQAFEIDAFTLLVTTSCMP